MIIIIEEAIDFCYLRLNFIIIIITITIIMILVIVTIIIKKHLAIIFD